MKPIQREQRRLRARPPRERRDVNEADSRLLRLLPVHRVEAVDLGGDPRRVASALPGEWGHSPIGDRQDDDAPGVASGQGGGAGEHSCEGGTVGFRVGSAVLVVHPDEQGDQIVGTSGGGRIDSR